MAKKTFFRENFISKWYIEIISNELISNLNRIQCTMNKFKGLGSTSRKRLSQVLSVVTGIITSDEVARVLKVPRDRAIGFLARWEKSGWLKRIRRGTYIPIPLESTTGDVVIEDPWIIAYQIFEPCYLGGWSAAEHWGFTEQIFQSVAVVTGKRVNTKIQKVGEVDFFLKMTSKEMIFGTKTLWRDGQKVEISDPTRTIIDVLNDPALAGGIRSAEDMLIAYLSSEHFDKDKLLDYGERLNNRTVFKRLGFLIERRAPAHRRLISDCLLRISKGYSQLDFTVKGRHVKRRWGLFVPEAYVGTYYDS